MKNLLLVGGILAVVALSGIIIQSQLSPNASYAQPRVPPSPPK